MPQGQNFLTDCPKMNENIHIFSGENILAKCSLDKWNAVFPAPLKKFRQKSEKILLDVRWQKKFFSPKTVVPQNVPRDTQKFWSYRWKFIDRSPKLFAHCPILIEKPTFLQNFSSWSSRDVECNIDNHAKIFLTEG